ncbi:TlpA family protein disulfide reductase [Kordia jejudonensis]|uniref:TlpA family protein disulfide reductase n=1 Tax=Kordia jejudonensis TaxID=1348245 RepID=UPI000629081D|nr:TlpA disulfide reductase family protein [Kordia jejudonensis]
MKPILFSLLLVLCISCTVKEQKPASIKVNAPDIQFIEVRNPIDDFILWNEKTDTIYKNEQDEFVFTKTIETPEFINVIIGQKNLKAILLPGQRIEIIPQDSAYVFTGKHNAGMEFLNSVERPYFTMTESNKFKNDTLVTQVVEKINLLKNAELETLQNSIDTKKIDPKLEEILKKEIDYFYAMRTAQIVTTKQYFQTTIPDDFLALFEETVTTYPLETEYKPSFWNTYANTVLKEHATYEVLSEGTITKDSLQNYYTNDKMHPFHYNLIRTYENQSVAEKAAAAYIIEEAKQTKFEKSLISVFEQFQEDFPNSVYTPYLKPDIDKIREYHLKISGEMPADVKFYENETVASLTDLLADLKGEPYYIDLWATWCSPCKREFKHNDTLNALLKEKGYKKLYISLDKPEKRTKWEQDIKYFELDGLHLLASQEFFVDFEKNHSLVDGYVTIPQYLIVDKKGNLVTNNAPRPSDIAKLRAFLEK